MMIFDRILHVNSINSVLDDLREFVDRARGASGLQHAERACAT
jgi:hypothetical protein